MGAARDLHSRWPDGADEVYAAAVRERLNPLGRCSWCLLEKRQALELVTMRGAEVFTCGGCARPTHRCTSCGPAAGGGGVGGGAGAMGADAAAAAAFCRTGDTQCARCAGLIYDWEASVVNDELTRRQGWCSWCGERCAHLVRDARREHYQCLVCGGGTAPCERCPGVMRTRSRPSPGGRLGNAIESASAILLARSGGAAAAVGVGVGVGAGGGSCMRCDVRAATPRDEVDAVWEAIQTRRAAADQAAPHVLDQLRRPSRYKTRAYLAGLSRPFMLLATLPPRERIRLGMRLGISLARRPGYLDPHAEAWTLLAAPRR